MLICSAKRYYPTDVNMIVLEKDGLYFYVHRSLYDQAVILDDMLSRCSIDEMCLKIRRSKPEPMVYEFVEKAPRPISALGCFLILVAEPLTDFIDMCGAIHVMSGPLSFRRMIDLPPELQNSVQFSLSVKEEYELAWDRWFDLNASAGASVRRIETDESEVEVPTHTADEYDTGGDDEFADFLAAWESAMDEDDEEDESTEETSQVDNVSTPAEATVPTPAPAPEPQPEPQPSSTGNSGLDFLLNLNKGGH